MPSYRDDSIKSTLRSEVAQGHPVRYVDQSPIPFSFSYSFYILSFHPLPIFSFFLSSLHMSYMLLSLFLITLSCPTLLPASSFVPLFHLFHLKSLLLTTLTTTTTLLSSCITHSTFFLTTSCLSLDGF